MMHQYNINNLKHKKIFEKIEKTSTCWYWKGALTKKGYGNCKLGKESLAHRVVYIIIKGNVPPLLHHTCHNKACVNPDHLEPTTIRQNGRLQGNNEEKNKEYDEQESTRQIIYTQKPMDNAVLNILKKIAICGKDECWMWMGATHGNGYSRMVRDGITQSPHRIMFELFVERIPDDKIVHHTCNNKLCCNPDHLKLVTHSKNISIARKQKTESIKGCKVGGHLYTEDNLIKCSTQRRCKICEDIRRKAMSEHKRVLQSLKNSSYQIPQYDGTWAIDIPYHPRPKLPIRKYCEKNHKMIPENLAIDSTDGHAKCRECRRLGAGRHYDKYLRKN